MAGDLDITIARLQLAELQSSLEVLQDSRVAMQLHFSAANIDIHVEHIDGSDPDASEEQQLQEQVAILQSLVDVADDQQYALESIAAEEAAHSASLLLATALEAEEQWEAAVLRPQDAALAQAVAGRRAEVWGEGRSLLEQPLDLTGLLAAAENAQRIAGAAPPVSMGARPVAARTSNPVAAASPASNSSSCCTSTSHHHPVGSGSSAGSSGRRLDCGICFESFPADRMVSAMLPAAMASSSRAAGRCSHTYCTGCMRQYITGELQARKYPLSYPHPGCGEVVAAADVTRLLAEQAPLLQVYQTLEAEQVVALEQRVFCPFKDCSALLERPEADPADGGGGQDAPYECPNCNRGFCAACGITGWHTGLSCRDYQALPPELRTAEDAAVLHIAKEKQWKRCPNCGHVVERTAGCNHMVCRCGCNFCYACGAKYTSNRPAANNVHGTQGCRCALFPVPDEPARRRARAARPVVPRAPAARRRAAQ